MENKNNNHEVIDLTSDDLEENVLVNQREIKEKLKKPKIFRLSLNKREQHLQKETRQFYPKVTSMSKQNKSESFTYQNEVTKKCEGIECPICLQLTRNVMTTQCGHLFCKACLAIVFTSSDKTPLCPICHSQISPITSHRIYL
ncbi:hypothetical protein EDI_338170 [Entamoeba dispar SAW760]|uniref:RING-type domain-containing protein n=1 Tax=Entamoeba dispar (strain ATCC PRA-260 / SAW760) TaxID=370354 RepID=B0EA77_ENTDS|nr:uncharacterized protein EDI_338170 [Entamoeba dispar SAW760]EDR28564.1 hypothetical protein EDI_338170 [Entamoeba dispar SAW760]|eukprot:EDR28564.1 hypothetical protein EDI_338170 [Entamoeba dispar SAW760]